jgi:hypothetical protein
MHRLERGRRHVIAHVSGVPVEESPLPSAHETGKAWRHHDYKG